MDELNLRITVSTPPKVEMLIFHRVRNSGHRLTRSISIDSDPILSELLRYAYQSIKA